MSGTKNLLGGFFASRRRAITAGLLWFLLCLLWTAPAQLFVAVLKPLLPQLQLQAVSGSFWRGSAGQALWQQDGRAIALGSFDWRLSPWSLLWLHPSLHLSTSYGEQLVDTDMRVSPLGRITLRDTRAALPIATLSAWVPLPASGTLGLNLERASFKRGEVSELTGAISWQRAQWQWNKGWLALGDYRCALNMPVQNQIHCALEGRGAFAANGELNADLAKKIWTAQAQLTLAPTLPAEFRQAVSLLLAGQSTPQQSLQLQREGKW